MSILVKGPVSLVMIGLALFLYGLISSNNRKPEMLKNGTIYLLAGTALSSIWFILCYLKYGDHFINYFFLRENLGKFESQSYPIRKLFQGLVLYGLPWSILLIPYIKKFKNFNKDKLIQIKENPFLSFCFLSFISFFFIWFIPTQRSHHYAIPALPFFLILFYPLLKEVRSKNLLKINFLIFGLLGFIGLFLSIRFFDSFSYGPLIISILILGALPIGWKFKDDLKAQALVFLGAFSLSWSLLIPQFSLPKLPQAMVKKITTQSVHTIFKKNYYFEQILGHKIISLHAHEVKNLLKNSDGYYILTEHFYKQARLENTATILGRWPVWKRRVKWPLIKTVLKEKDLSKVQEIYLLLKGTSID
jgi:multisubunit Na+/H+ antiporter MnhB subunit